MYVLPVLAMLTMVWAESGDRPTVVIVVGAPARRITPPSSARWADQWKAAAARGGAESIPIGTSTNPPGSTDRDRLQAVLSERSTAAAASRSGSS